MAVDVEDDVEGAKRFVAEKRITFAALRGSWELARRFGVTGTPASVLVGRDGRVYFSHGGLRGAESVARLERQIEALLSRP
jgi:hypothetical protein